ncbi:hypothetical protein [Niastella populi]|uniref:Lipoprotein n=1 Tax=Niastella populi TaxID=550983 RepID=A0A1V9GDL9_9BACT|nr:hypothetical protein [Niastella populi]OQP68642.1 hypothetical protein A4R26_02270 [Niastella populi]
MTNIKPSTFAVAFFIFISCGNPGVNESDKQKPDDISKNIDSTALLVANMKKAHPYFDLKLDSSLVDTAKYPAIYYPDASDCNSFRFDRTFLGKLSMAKATVQKESSADRLHLKTGNLNLWVCSLPNKVKAGDTVLITVLVYDIFGSEKTWGYPTIVTEIRMSY